MNINHVKLINHYQCIVKHFFSTFSDFRQRSATFNHIQQNSTTFNNALSSFVGSWQSLKCLFNHMQCTLLNLVQCGMNRNEYWSTQKSGRCEQKDECRSVVFVYVEVHIYRYLCLRCVPFCALSWMRRGKEHKLVSFCANVLCSIAFVREHALNIFWSEVGCVVEVSNCVNSFRALLYTDQC